MIIVDKEKIEFSGEVIDLLAEYAYLTHSFIKQDIFTKESLKKFLDVIEMMPDSDDFDMHNPPVTND